MRCMCVLCTDLQGWSKCEGVFCVVAPRQLRVVERIYGAVWVKLRGLQRWTEALPQALRALVQEVPKEIKK
jgi:hypothetical protein